jgi:hypothetical protein
VQNKTSEFIPLLVRGTIRRASKRKAKQDSKINLYRLPTSLQNNETWIMTKRNQNPLHPTHMKFTGSTADYSFLNKKRSEHIR